MRGSVLYILACGVLLTLQMSFGARRAEAQVSEALEKPAVFHVKYVSEDAVYIDGGRNAEIKEGMKLSVVATPADGAASDGVRFRGEEHVAELNVTSVADSSSVCEIVKANAEISQGQLAFLSPESVEQRHEFISAAQAGDYPIVLTFTNGDPLDEELREVQERKVLENSPVGRIRGRFGVNYGGTNEAGGFNTKQIGVVIDSDMTQIGGTYWNFTGYWRGNFTTSKSSLPGTSTPTLSDLMNRTYHLGFTYQSPYSRNVVGFGRLFLPWAPSLSTLDGGYFGRKIARRVTIGMFAGSTPDPTSWSYTPNQHLAGTFVNFEAGSFDRTRFFSTAGIAVASIQWRVSRQFAFFENNWSWKRYINFYNSLQADEARTSPLPNGGSNPTGISQSYSSLHFQPVGWLTFGVNHNYFRSLPTFDPTLVGTGLLDQYLFQGFSGDARVELVKHIAVYSSLGRSSTSTDTRKSLNQAYGLTFGNIWKTGLNADFHYSKFDSAFGGGQYESVSISRNLAESFRIQVLGGHQIFNSGLSADSHSDFVNGTADWNVGTRYFLEANYGWYRGTVLNYRQWSSVFGYRFGGLRRNR